MKQPCYRAIAPLILLAIALTSCVPSAQNPPPEPPTLSLTISAAASLQTALSEINPLFEQTHPNINISENSGGSGVLQRQIEQGAPVDIFLSASPLQMDALAQKDLLIESSRRDLLSNQLALIAPFDSELQGFEEMGRAANFQRLAVGEFQSVPAGSYAQATLTAFGLLPKIAPKLIFFNNVSGVLAAVESGNVDAGVVYETDAQLSARVKVVAIAPPSTHPPIRYPIAILKRTQHPEAAQQYIDFLTTPQATQTFQRLGFTVLTQ